MLQTVRIAQQRAGLDGQHDILVAGIGAFDVMHIIGGDEIGVIALAQFKQGLVDRHQFGNIMTLQFKEEVIRPESLVIPVQLQPAGFGALSRMVRGTSPDMQEVVAISPSEWFCRKSWSTRG